MNGFLLKLATFLVVASLSCAGLFVAVALLNQHAVGGCHLNKGVDSVVVGDSHTAWAIDDAEIPGLQNISLNAEGYKYTYRKLEHLLESEPQLKRVYLAFSYANLSAFFDDYVTGASFRFYADHYLGLLTFGDYIELVRNSPSTAVDLFARLLRSGVPSGIRQRCAMYGQFSPGGSYRRETFRFDVMKKRILEQYYLNGSVQGVSEENLDYLQKIVRLVRSHGVELVALSTPLHPEYSKRIPAKFRELYSQVLTKDAIPSFEFDGLKLGDADFLPDGDHLNYPGALLATRRFAQYYRAHPVSHAGIQ